MGLAELMLQLLGPDDTPRLAEYRRHEGDPMFAPDTLLVWRSTPFSRYRVWSEYYDISVRNNSLGLRGPEPDELPVDSDCRVVVVGDSFVQGLTVGDEDTFARTAERTLATQYGMECRVIPAGVEAYATDQELQFFRRDLVAYRPTLTVLFLYFNDIWCNGRDDCHRGPARERHFRLENGQLVWKESGGAGDDAAAPRPLSAEPTRPVAEQSARRTEQPIEDSGPAQRVRRWLNDNSKLYGLARRSARLALGLENRDRMPRRSVWFTEPLPRELHVFRARYDPELQTAWDLTERLILELAASARANGSQFALLHVPHRPAIDPEEWEFNLSLRGLATEEWDPRRIEALLAQFCAEHGIRCVDPSEEFRHRIRSPAQPLYLQNDPHWTVHGHRAVGRILAELIGDVDGLEEIPAAR